MGASAILDSAPRSGMMDSIEILSQQELALMLPPDIPAPDLSAAEVPIRAAGVAAGADIDLTMLANGEVGTVAGVNGDDTLAHRLHALGLWPGAVVERLTSAPFGGPLLVRLHGFRLALRRSEARRVTVHRLGGSA